MAARDAAIICLLFFAGFRANEVSGLNVGDYNGVEVMIREAKHDSTGRVPVNCHCLAIWELPTQKKLQILTAATFTGSRF
jgi:site-specific recombinase XerC